MPDNSARQVIDYAQQLANRVDPGWRTRTRHAVSRALKQWALKIPWASLRATEDFVLSGNRTLVFPERVGQVIRIMDITNGRELGATGNWPHRATGTFAQDTAGNPSEWQDRGFVPFTSQLATDSTLQLAAGGSEAFEVRISGFVRDAAASGTALELQEHFEIMTMGGTEYTATSATWAQLTGIEKEFGTTNWLKARSPLNAQVIAFIPPGEATVQHRAVDFIPVPPAGIQVRVEYFRKPEEIHSEDYPIDSAVDLEYLAWQAAGDLHWMMKEGQAAGRAWTKAREIIEARLAQEKQNPSHKATRPAFTYLSLEQPIGYRFEL